jgi:hypothetical protein
VGWSVSADERGLYSCRMSVDRTGSAKMATLGHAVPGPTDVPSARRLAFASAAALMVAAVISVAIVLPAEYGIDPIGTGRLLGLSVMSAPIVDPDPVPASSGPVKMTPTVNGPLASYPAPFHVDSREIVLEPYEYKEFKYYLEQGGSMVFSWTASGPVLHDFHGDADTGAVDAAQSYDKQARRQASGSFTAPFAGIHGWYWENEESQPVTITLTTAGFYTAAHEFHMNRTRRQRQVGGLDRIAPAPDAEVPK